MTEKMTEVATTPRPSSGISPTKLTDRNQIALKTTLHVFLPNGEFRAVKYGDNSDLKVSIFCLHLLLSKIFNFVIIHLAIGKICF